CRDVRRDFGRQSAVWEAIVIEDVGKRGGDDAADPEIKQCPGSMLARGSAAEVVARHQDLRLAVGGLVQHKVGDILALFVVAQFVKEVFAKPGALDRLQELLGNDRVSVDVDYGQRCGDGGELGELLHVSLVSVRLQTRL